MKLDGINKLRDDVKGMEEKFDVSSYLNKSEAGKYLAEKLPGIKDLIDTIKSIVGEISAFINKLLDMLTQLLSWLDLNKILSALGLDKLLGFIFNLVNDGLFGFGLPLDLKNRLMKLFKDACIDINGGFKQDQVESFALTAFLISLICSNMDETYSTTLNLYKSNTKLESSRTELSILQQEKDILDGTNTTEVDAKIATLTESIETNEFAIDVLFMQTIPKIFGSLSKGSVGDSKDIMATVNDIASTKPGRMYGEHATGLSPIIISAIDSSFKSVPVLIKDDIKTGGTLNFLSNKEFGSAKQIKDTNVNNAEYTKLLSSMTVLDKSFMTGDYSATYSSPAFRDMSRRHLSGRELITLTPGAAIAAIKLSV